MMSFKILIVEDNTDFRSAIKQHIQRQKWDAEIYEAYTAEMGVTKAACIKADVVLMDLNLPGENGFNACRQIKEDNPQCAVIILTMFEIESFKKLANESLAADFVGKSEVHERLVPAIQRCLQGREGKKKGEG